MKILWSATLCAVVTLSGCATTWRVDNDVQSFSSLAATAPGPATFRFDRLPSQQATPAQQAHQAELEALALPALIQAGLVQDPVHARFNVQVGARLQQVAPYGWDNPFPYRAGWWPRTSIYYGRGGPHSEGLYGTYGFVGSWGYPGWGDVSYQREVSVVLRDAGTGQVVYETRAAHLGRWPVDKDVLPPMFQAALTGFPQPPAGLRRVNIELPIAK